MKQGTARFELSDVQEYMPGAYQALVDVMKLVGLNEEGTWERFRRDGKLVQIPNVWFGGQFPHGIAWRMDVLEDLGFDDVPGTYDDIDAVFAAFKAKYENQSPYACPAKGLTWQCFPMIFDGTGWAQWRWNLRDGRLVRGFNQPEMKLGYEVAQDWYEKGYIDPEFPTYDSGTNVNLFRNGQTIVKEWIGYGSWDDSLDRPGTEGNWIRKVVPEARIKMGPFPSFSEDVRPARYVWNPFHGGSYGFGRHLESRPDDLHLIMQIMDKMNTDEAYNTLTNLGIEGHALGDQRVRLSGAQGGVHRHRRRQADRRRLLLGRAVQLHAAFGELAAPRRRPGAAGLPHGSGRHLLGCQHPAAADHPRSSRSPMTTVTICGASWTSEARRTCCSSS